MGHIYMLTSPSGKSYIGQTTRPIEKRFKEHQLERSGCIAIRDAIQKYGWENFEKDYYECPDEDIDFDEELLIREIGTLSPDGYNLKEGKNNPNSKRVYQYGLEGTLLGSFGSTLEASRYFKKSQSTSISRCANGVKGFGTAYGFKWAYQRDDQLNAFFYKI